MADTVSPGFIERMQGEPQVSDATLDELLQVYEPATIAQMYTAGLLTPAQSRAWLASLPTPPAFGAPVPE